MILQMLIEQFYYKNPMFNLKIMADNSFYVNKKHTNTAVRPNGNQIALKSYLHWEE